MHRRLKHIALSFLMVFAGAVIIDTWPKREPEYHDKFLHEWLHQYIGTEQNPKLRAEAETAIRHIGTNALPFLLDWLREDASRFTGRDYPEHGIAGFKILGEEADSAIPALEHLADAPRRFGDSSEAKWRARHVLTELARMREEKESGK